MCTRPAGTQDRGRKDPLSLHGPPRGSSGLPVQSENHTRDNDADRRHPSCDRSPEPLSQSSSSACSRSGSTATCPGSSHTARHVGRKRNAPTSDVSLHSQCPRWMGGRLASGSGGMMRSSRMPLYLAKGPIIGDGLLKQGQAPTHGLSLPPSTLVPALAHPSDLAAPESRSRNLLALLPRD